ncbi:Crp/Fnr family transcriptional regulator [Kurthia gibsonii]|uniref:Crp/Fnr family transcriptional regulator n=1 Tax=Kurthia TaxID=1649 RepID=UPI000745E71E|nr:Crp/Fnr family transcriptional regulator [Kurthia sp. 11kri321]AMA63436.1 bacterial regulatory s, crp family protein [Kurthia sp. 11kri321]
MFDAVPQIVQQIFKAHGTKHHFVRHQHICTTGEAATHLYFVEKGRIAITKESVGGKELTLCIATKNDCIGESILFIPLITYPLSAKVLDCCTVFAISKEQLEHELSENLAALRECLTWIQIQRMREQTKLRDLLLYGKKGALSSTLIRLANSYGEKKTDKSIQISEKFTHSELASLCATSREVVNRLLQEFKKEKVISEENGYLTIHRLDYLQQFCECEQCVEFLCRIN